jgi:hypothetical protein
VTDRLLSAALERIPPQLEAPSEARESSESSGPTDIPSRGEGETRASTERQQSPAERRSWWRRVFGS